MSNRSSSREWNSAEYHRLSQPQVSWGKKVLARLKLRGDEVVLDAGCGTGRLTGELLEALPRGRVIGLDLSQNMLRTARVHLLPDFGERVRFVVADLPFLPFDRALDGVISTAAFHWVLDHEQLFRSLFRALRPGGWLQAQCGGGPNLARLRARMQRLAQAPAFAPYLADFPEPWLYQNAEGAAKTLRSAGFVEVETGLEAAPTVLEDRQRFLEFVSTVIVRSHLELITDPSLRSRYVSELADQAAGDDPPFSLDYWRLNLSAKVP